MKTKLTILTLLLIAAIGVKAQNLIVVQHAGAPTTYSDLPTAITNTAAGDTVYIPGGSYPAITISKKLFLVGVGANPDSTKTTGRTNISGITLGTGADNGSVVGIYSIGGISIPVSINGYTISRCYIGQLNSTTNISNFLINENIVGLVGLSNGQSCNLSNNIFTSGVAFVLASYIKNNMFLYPGGGQLEAQSSIIENNIFEFGNGGSFVVSGGGNSVYNNVNVGVNFSGSGGVNIAAGDQGSNNFLLGQFLNTIFSTYNQSVLTSDGIYEVNFNLPVGSSYKNAGTDGTDIGIYGGAYPWKPGSIPSNPHFQSINIAPTTDSSGNLKVQITVAAQNN